MKPELLLVSPMPPRVIDALKDDFVLHDYYRAKDKPAMLKEVGNTVRAYISFASAGGADAALMDATPKVELIANWGVGYDRVDAPAAKARGIVVTNTPDVLTDCCADLAMALILAVASDFLLLTCPGGPETHHLVNAEVLTSLGPDGFLVNIARGSVVDEDALVAAL